MIEAFRLGLLRNLDLFVDLTKNVPYIIEESYGKAIKFVNLKREIKLARKGKSIMEDTPEKE